MSDFSEMLSFAIKSRNINVNEMIQYCGIDRSTMYQIIRGKRKPANMRLVEEIAAFMELSPSERQRFIDTYEITRIGKEKFYSRKSVYQFLLDFDLLNSKDFLKLDTPPFIDVPFCDADSKSLICLSRQSQISAYIHRIFKQESSKEYGKIYIIAQPKHLDKINLSAYLLNFGDNISIQHILCMDNSKDILSSEQNYNINCFKTLLPFYGMQYEYIPYYYYDQVSSHFGSFNLMPCLFLTSSEAVVCSDDLMEGFYFSSPDVISSLSRYFHNALSNAKPLSTSFRSVLDTFLQNFYHKTSSQTMQYYLAAEPCLIRFFRDEILEQHLKSDIPDRENVLELLKAYVRKQKSFKNYYYFFTKKGMENFLETGRLHEIPDEIYEAFHYSDRIDFLRQLYEENQAQPRTFLLKGNLADIPDNFNLFGSASTGFLLFSKYYGLPSFLLLQEPKIIQSFYDFLSSIIENHLATSLEETQQYLKDLLEQACVYL